MRAREVDGADLVDFFSGVPFKVTGVFDVFEVTAPAAAEFLPKCSELLVLDGVSGEDAPCSPVERIEIYGAACDVPGAAPARACDDGSGGGAALRVDSVLLRTGAPSRPDPNTVACESLVVPREPFDHGSGVPVVGGKQVVGVLNHSGRIPKSWPDGRVLRKVGVGGANGFAGRS